MTNPEDWPGKIGLIASILGALVILLTNLRKLYVLLKPVLIWAVFLGTIVIPNGLLTWVWMYAAATNSSRLAEPQVFFFLIAQLTAAVSVYTFCWGKWLYPRLDLWLKKQLLNAKLSRAQRKDKSKRNDTEPSEDDE